MQILLTRQEIRRQVRAMLGMVTTEAAATGDKEQMDAFIDAASLKVHQDCRWQLSQRRVTVDLGQEQSKIAYPADCGIGNVTHMAIWDETQYIPLTRTTLNIQFDFDQLEAAGGEAFRAIQGRPEFYECRNDFIHLWRPNNQTARKLRLEYQLRMTFTNDQQQSTVDAMAIIYWTLALKRAAIGDKEGQSTAQGLYEDRVASMRAWANSGTPMNYDESANYDDVNDPARPRPNWDTRPTVR